jgi:fumarate reductase subunit C
LLLLLLLLLLALSLLLLFTKTTESAVPKATAMTVKRTMMPYCMIFVFGLFSGYFVRRRQ